MRVSAWQWNYGNIVLEPSLMKIPFWETLEARCVHCFICSVPRKVSCLRSKHLILDLSIYRYGFFLWYSFPSLLKITLFSGSCLINLPAEDLWGTCFSDERFISFDALPQLCTGASSFSACPGWSPVPLFCEGCGAGCLARQNCKKPNG